MRHFAVMSALGVLLGACGGSQIKPEPIPTPAANCPYAPIGWNSWVSLLVANTRGDTLRRATVTIRSRRDKSSFATARPVADSTGRFRVGPLAAGEYRLDVQVDGYRSASTTVGFCRDSEYRLVATLSAR